MPGLRITWMLSVFYIGILYSVSSVSQEDTAHGDCLPQARNVNTQEQYDTAVGLGDCMHRIAADNRRIGLVMHDARRLAMQSSVFTHTMGPIRGI